MSEAQDKLLQGEMNMTLNMAMMTSARDAVGKCLATLGGEYDNMLVLTADIDTSSRIQAFKEKYPDRCYNVGIAEQNLMSVSAGLAHEGFRPLAFAFAPFASMRCYEQVRTDICYSKLPVVIIGNGAGYSNGASGCTHCALEYSALMVACNNMTVLEPGDPFQIAKLLEAAMELNAPVYIRLGREATSSLYPEDTKYEIGKALIPREGDDGAAFTFTNTYGVAPTDSSVTDQVKTVKRLTGRDLAAGEFTFELLEDGVVVASGTNDVNGNVTLSPIRYEAPGTHTYMLREACPNALGLYKGVTYDGTTYTVVTTVSDNGDGTLTATHKLEGTTESAGFTNKYHAMPTQVSIGAVKVLEGRELKKDEFSFKLVGEDIESTVTNDADGKINFDKFEYDEPGTYVYTISEVKGDEAGMTYDKSVFTATVNVADDGEGNLKANVAFAKGDKSVEGIVFNNTYKKPETPVPTPDPGTPKTVTNIVKTVKGFLPTTGDQQAAALLMAFVIAMAGVGALVWGIRKR